MDRTVFFDFGGTLAYEPLPHAESFHIFLRDHGIEANREEVDAGIADMEAFHEEWRAAHPEDGSKMLADRFWFHACLRFARHIRGIRDAHDLAELMHASHTIIPYRLYDDTLPALDAIASRGFKMGIISNWDAPTLEFATHDLGIRGYFVMVLSSRCAECEKPWPRIFLEACRRAGATPETSVMIGDNVAADIQGARNVGITPIWINRDGAPQRQDCLTIPTLAELPGIIETLWNP